MHGRHRKKQGREVFGTLQKPRLGLRDKPTEMQTQVLVVGAGPVGLVSAIALVKAGIQVVIVDAAEAGKNGSRAAVIQANTLEVCLIFTHRGLLISFD